MLHLQIYTWLLYTKWALCLNTVDSTVGIPNVVYQRKSFYMRKTEIILIIMANKTAITRSTIHIDRAALSFQELKGGILLVNHQLNLEQQIVVMKECGLRLLSIDEILKAVMNDPYLKKELTEKTVRISGLDPAIDSGTYAINKEDGRVDTSRIIMGLHEDYRNNRHDPETHIFITDGRAPLSVSINGDEYTQKSGSRYVIIPGLHPSDITPVSLFARDYLSKPKPYGSVFNYWTILNQNPSAFPPLRRLPND